MRRAYPPITTHERYLTALGERDPIESMRKSPRRVHRLIKHLRRKQLERCIDKGQWSIKQVLAHLADHEFMLGARVRMTASMERPTLTGYDQDAFVRHLAHDVLSPRQLFEDFAAARAINVALLERLPQAAWARVALHSERGEESLATMLFMYAGHDRLHEAQIERLAQALEASAARGKRSDRRKGRASDRRSKRGG